MPAPKEPAAHPASGGSSGFGVLDASTGGSSGSAQLTAESSDIVGSSPSLELAAAEGEDGSDSLAQLLQAALAQHTSIVTGLRVENLRLQEVLAAGGGAGLHANQGSNVDLPGLGRFEAAGDDPRPWEGRLPSRLGSGDGGVVKQPVAHADDCWLDQEEDANGNLPCYESSAKSEAMFSSEQSGTVSPSSKKATKSRSSVSAVLKRKQDQRSNPLGRLERCINGPFDKLCSLAIVLNVVFIFIQLQQQGWQQAAHLGTDAGNPWPDVDAAFNITEMIFNVFFGIELVLRISVLRTRFFLGERGIELLNFFDAFLVIASCFDLYLSFQGRSSRSMNLNVLRPFRFLRLLRTLRILRSVRVFSKLNMLVNTVAASFMALFWSIVLLTISMLMGALFLCQSLSSSLEDEAISPETRIWIFRMYGTSARAFYTVFELTFSGGWPNYARTLVEEVSSIYAVFFFVYIIVVVFAMFRIITALFLRDTLAVASNDAEVAVQEKIKQKERYAAKLLEFFHAADTSQDGSLTLAELEAILLDNGVRTWLSIMEVDVHDTEQLFEILDDGDGAVSANEFVEGILRLKGHARSQDVLRIMHCCHKLMHDISAINARMGSIDCTPVECDPFIKGR